MLWDVTCAVLILVRHLGAVYWVGWSQRQSCSPHVAPLIFKTQNTAVFDQTYHYGMMRKYKYTFDFGNKIGQVTGLFLLNSVFPPHCCQNLAHDHCDSLSNNMARGVQCAP